MTPSRKKIMKKIDQLGHYITPSDPKLEINQKLVNMMVSDDLIAKKTNAGNLIFKKNNKESL